MIIIPSPEPIINLTNGLYVRCVQIDGEPSEIRIDPQWYGYQYVLRVVPGEFPQEETVVHKSVFVDWERALDGVEAWIAKPAFNQLQEVMA